MAVKKTLSKKNSERPKTAKKTVKKSLATAPVSYNLLDRGPKFSLPHLQKEAQEYIAEFLGTALLTFAVTLNIGYGELVLATPLLAALIVGLAVYTLGGISGANLNPAVTLALFATKNLSYKKAISYILAQFTGAIVAVTAYLSFNLAIPELFAYDSAQYFGLELIGTLILAFSVLNVANRNVTQGASGLVVGGALFAGIAVAGNFSLGILNPAIALSWGIFNYTYLVAPLVAGLAAAAIYKILNWK